MAIINAKPNKSVVGTRFDDEIHLNGAGNASGGAGNDVIYQGTGRNLMDGGAGADIIYGDGNDTLRGGAGDDWLTYTAHAGDTDGSIQASKGVVSGGAGHDTLSFKVSSDASVTPIEVTMTGESAGTVSIGGQQKLTFTGVNGIIDESWPFETNGSLIYHGENADTDMFVMAGVYDSTFYGGQGNEVFTGGSGDDSFVFVFKEGGMGHDRIGAFGQYTGPADPYEKGFDTISFQGAEGKLTTVVTEFPVDPPPEYPDDYQGFTRYQSYYADGTLAHTLDVDALGLPPISYDAIIG
jgi:Ca2+-binding RTX toxin-like protein